MRYFAHTARDYAWQPLAEHLRNVAILARELAQAASPGSELPESAYLAGLFHDLGKYRKGFQRYLRGEITKSDSTYHKNAGAAWMLNHRRPDVAFAIAGHHGGIPDQGTVRGLASDEVSAGLPAAKEIWATAIADLTDLNKTIPGLPHFEKNDFRFDLWIRILFSCLVDADWKDTNRYVRRSKDLADEPAFESLNPAAKLEEVLCYINGRSMECKQADLASIREEILSAALKAATAKPGLFTMSVPTGGGKTLSSLAFALAHANANDLRRVIYVAPYLSILEQNAAVIRKALGVADDSDVVFEHHSLAEPNEEGSAGESDGASAAYYRRSDAWDPPIILTTNVQFFESLFSNQPSRCRKLHNIARSVVILDECQSVPKGLILPTRSMLESWSSMFGTSFVFCTATQPHWFTDVSGRAPVEIIPESLDLFSRLERVQVLWPASKEESWDWPAVAARMTDAPAALCIVNLKKSAAAVYHAMQNAGLENPIHLSTAMCPAHRRETIDEIRRRLAAGEPCHVVSTQLIEAGVDVDFPVVLREIGPFDSILQAAGRCNREGLLRNADGSPGGRVVVFRAAAGGPPHDFWYEAGIHVLETNFLQLTLQPSVSSPQDVGSYFRAVYKVGDCDERDIQAMRGRYDFPETASKYRLIDQAAESIVVASWASRSDEIEHLLAEADRNPSHANFRKLNPFMVNLFANQFAQFCQDGLIERDGPAGLAVWRGCYDPKLGLDPKEIDLVI